MTTWRGMGVKGKREEPKRAREKQTGNKSKRGKGKSEERGQASPFIVGQAYLAVARLWG